MKKFAIELKWGVIFTLALLLWTGLEKALGWHGPLIEKHAFYSLLFILPAFLIYYFALKEKRDKFLGGTMTWQQGFVSGMLVSLVVALLSPFSQYITHEIISPEYFENLIKLTVNGGKMSQENAEKYFNLKSYIGQSAVFALGSGIVTSAIVALLIRKS